MSDGESDFSRLFSFGSIVSYFLKSDSITSDSTCSTFGEYSASESRLSDSALEERLSGPEVSSSDSDSDSLSDSDSDSDSDVETGFSTFPPGFFDFGSSRR